MYGNICLSPYESKTACFVIWDWHFMNLIKKKNNWGQCLHSLIVYDLSCLVLYCTFFVVLVNDGETGEIECILYINIFYITLVGWMESDVWIKIRVYFHAG